MLRVGLTGDLGSGKSTVLRMLAERGAVVFSSDEMARAMMQPGEPVYMAIVAAFGQDVVTADGELDRGKLARLAFDAAAPQVETLNAIVHPAVLAAQAEAIASIEQKMPHAVVVVESALLFTTQHAGRQPWRSRFDCVVLVTASEEAKVQRFVERVAAGRELDSAEQSALREDARRRLALQAITAEQTDECLLVRNDGDMAKLALQVDVVWDTLLRRESLSQNG